jgi:hypothetical protein
MEKSILIFKGHPSKFPTQVNQKIEFDNIETYMEIPFEFYLDMPEEEKAFVQGFNYYIDGNLKDARRELAKSASKVPEGKYMLALVNYLLGKNTEAKLLLTGFSSDWQRFIQTWRVPVLVVPFKNGTDALYISLDEKGLNTLQYLLEGKTPEEVAFILGL